MPPEWVWREEEPLASVRVVTWAGRTLAVRRRDEGVEVVALLSTDPQDFLDPRFAPGRTVPLGAPDP